MYFDEKQKDNNKILKIHKNLLRFRSPTLCFNPSLKPVLKLNTGWDFNTGDHVNTILNTIEME